MIKRKRTLFIFLTLFLCFAITPACSPNVISQDSILDDLPLIYPDEGAGRDMQVTLYYKLRGEPYLVAASDTISVRNSEYEAAALMARLSQGPGMLAEDLEPVLPEGVSALEVSVDKGIVFVTLNDEPFFEEERTVEDRRLSISSIINSLAELEGVDEVQLYDRLGRRLNAAQFGFYSSEGQLIGPMKTQEELILTPSKLVERTFFRIVQGDYSPAYELFALNEPEDEGKRVSIQEFEAAIKDIGGITDMKIISITHPAGRQTASVEVDIVYNGGKNTIKGAILSLVESERYRISLSSFMDVITSAQ